MKPVGIDVQLCGDAHLSNFGGFAAPDRTLVFDVNDFDEANPGPFEWDVKGMAASFEIAARSLNLHEKVHRLLVATSTRSYRKAMRRFAKMGNLATRTSPKPGPKICTHQLTHNRDHTAPEQVAQ